jgi:hypothetical protein
VNELVEASLQFPTVVFTIVLGVVLIYWLFVLLGALDIDLLGGGHVGELDVTGAAKGLGEVLTGGAKAGGEALHAHGSDGAGDHAGGDHAGDPHTHGSWWHGLGLGDVPVTISVSLIVMIAWCSSLLGAHYIASPDGWQRGVVLVVALIVALPIAALLVRPLAPVFAVKEGKTNSDYVGHACTISTGRVDERFGQATIEDGGSVLVIQVRCDRPGALARGDKALIIEFDRARQAYVVEPSADMLTGSDDDAVGTASS